MNNPTHAKTPRSRPPARRRILVVDDHPLTRYGIARLLELESDLSVCAEAQNAADALSAARQHQPDLVLADLMMPDGAGLELLKNLRALNSNLPVLVVSMHDEALYAERALRAGARGYIMKNEGGGKLVQAIRQVLEGKTYLSEGMARAALESFSGRKRGRGDSTLEKLTDREFEVFQLLGQGLTTREIGRRLKMSGKTVETHRLHIREKLCLKSGPALIQHAVRWVGTQSPTL